VRRLVIVVDDGVVITDSIRGGSAELRWNLSSDTRAKVSFEAGGGEGIRRWHVAVDDDPSSGWWSPHYAQRERCQVITCKLLEGHTVMTLIGAEHSPEPLAELRSMKEIIDA
jgi:hypothetical protein